VIFPKQNKIFYYYILYLFLEANYHVDTKTRRNVYCQYKHFGYYFDIRASDESEVRLLHKHPRNQICYYFNLGYTCPGFSSSYFPQSSKELFHEQYVACFGFNSNEYCEYCLPVSIHPEDERGPMQPMHK
jgi:hypothetical protein